MRIDLARLLGIVILATSAASRVDAQPIPVAPPFSPHDDLGNDQNRVQVGVADSDAAFIVWDTNNTAPSHSRDLAARKYSASGTPAAEFQFNQAFNSTQDTPHLAMNASADFVATWFGEPSQDGSRQLFARASSANGTLLANESQVNTDPITAASATAPNAVCRFEDDRFAVAWWHDTLRLRLYAGGGSPTTGEIDTTLAVPFQTPSLACLGTGELVLLWSANDTSQNGIFGQRYSTNGTPVGALIQVNQLIAGNQAAPRAAAARSGFAVVWASQSVSGTEIQLRRFTDGGSPVGAEAPIDSSIFSTLTITGFDVAPDGSAVIALGNSNDSPTVHALELRRTGEVLPGATEPSSDPTATGLSVGVGSGTYLLAWQVFLVDNDNLLAQRFVRRALWADDLETGDLVAWSAQSP